MERANLAEENQPADRARQASALGFALFLHALIFVVLSFVPEKPFVDPPTPISVELIILERPAVPESETAQDIPAEPAPDPPPIKRVEPVPPPVEIPPPEPEPQLEPPPLAPPVSEPLSILSTQDDQIGEPIPDRWRLPPGTRSSLDKTQQPGSSAIQAFAKSLDCLGFAADCAEQRKAVFAEEQLSGTDLVWMPSFAHSGLSDADLYGLSESEIRERLGIPTAGVNGIYIPFTTIGLDGAWWDRLHGVNKTCSYRWLVAEDGKREVQKVCPEQKGGADTIPLYRSGNEFQRRKAEPNDRLELFSVPEK